VASHREFQVQDQYRFELANSTILPDPSKMREGIYPEEYLFELLRSYMSKNDYTEYPIGVCDFPLTPEELLSTNYENAAIVSTYGWKSFSKYPIEKGLEYIIAAILPDIHHASTISHSETRGCPNDFCDELSEVDKGIQTGEYCDACRRRLFSDVEKGHISHAELTAVYRILDHVADRRICFVIMPFDKRFDRVYEIIRSTVAAQSFHCIRSDEIFQTRSVMNIVNEMLARSELIIADLTNRNPNVFYELGFAHALGKNSILMSQKKTDVPFDLRHRQYFTYTHGKKLSSSLARQLTKYLI
jgi:hypothetical protein